MQISKKNLIGLTVSVDFHNELKQTLEHNYTFFRKWYIVTESTDIETINICKQYKNVVILFFEIKKEDIFNKGGSLKFLQNIVHTKYPTCAKLIIDSDIILPKNFLELLKKNNITDVDGIYGAERSLYKNIETIYNNGLYPYGFFQLYFRNDVFYNDSKSCGVCDKEFVENFSSIYFLEFVLEHICEPYIYWNGRNTNIKQRVLKRNIDIQKRKRIININNKIKTYTEKIILEKQNITKKYNFLINSLQKQLTKKNSNPYLFLNENEKKILQNITIEQKKNFNEYNRKQEKLEKKINTIKQKAEHTIQKNYKQQINKLKDDLNKKIQILSNRINSYTQFLKDKNKEIFEKDK